VPADGGTYFAEVGAQRGDSFRSVARSGLVTTPPGAVSGDLMARFVTIPMGLTFRALGENSRRAYAMLSELLRY